jgi:hypothetical protein
MFNTALTELFPGLEHPIICGGMQYVGYAELAAAVGCARSTWALKTRMSMLILFIRCLLPK